MIIATYLVLYYFLPKYIIKEKQYLKFAGFFALNFLIASYLDEKMITSKWVYELLDTTQHQHKVLYQLHPYRNSFRLVSIMGLASMIRFYKIYLQEEKNRHALEEEHLATKLAFLKSQVNPHFLFNALNNIYSMAVQKEQPEIAAGLENLSGIMHYLTYESNAKWVPIEKEIELLKNYIEIQQLRIAETDDTTISFNVAGETKGKMIAPVILLPLVENAFKHGVKLDQKCLVSIKILIKENALNFHIKNTFFEPSRKEIKEKGIGLANVKKRLKLVYPERHQLEFKQIEGYYISVLQIDLEKGKKVIGGS